MMGCLEPIPIYIIKNVKEKVKLDFTQIEEAKSAQQRVLIFQYDANDEQLETSPLRRALESGGYCLVIRIWKGGSRWWNLNQAKDVRKLAIAEMEGYRLAREALGTKIPQLLYASNKENESPWAVFEYVGEKSTRFDGALKLYNQYWTECMIEVRNEFGFPEPHPRWGRVPVSESLPYAMRILNQITIPLHRYMFENKDSISLTQIRHLCGDEPESYETGYTYKWMIPLYKRALRAMQESLRKATVPDTELTKSLRILEMCINELDKEVVIELPGVLVHMDSQPQNLIFARTQDKDPWCISSVLDWEDCAYGDPRFELLLLGRKVCANREQAKVLWNFYQQSFSNLTLGPIDAWLHLETVHSLCTLLLQSMDLLGGGRSPWESKPDIWGKIEREFNRLALDGWAFCHDLATDKSSYDTK